MGKQSEQRFPYLTSILYVHNDGSGRPPSGTEENNGQVLEDILSQELKRIWKSKMKTTTFFLVRLPRDKKNILYQMFSIFPRE